MKSNNRINEVQQKCWTSYRHTRTALLLVLGLQIGSVQLTKAQDINYTRPSWLIGVAAGANFNFHEGTTQELNSNFTVPTAFHKGTGMGLYIAPLVEFHKPNKRWGVILQAGYDNRKGKFDQVISPCNCPADLSTNLTYITLEPSLRFAPFKSDFYLYGGPRLAMTFDESFVFKQGTNPDVPEQVANADVTGNFSHINKNLLSMQVGAGYDIQLSNRNKRTQFVLSPFISFHPYIGQDPRDIESWNLTTVRVGAAFKFGGGSKVENANKDSVGPDVPAAVSGNEDKVKFYVNSPRNISTKRTIRETFPLRNYVFFDIGSNEIPSRYILITKDSVKSFKEDQVVLVTPTNLSGRSDRQMIVYYNILNILGDRMGKYPNSTITLSGSSEKGPQDGRLMAESIKTYLTSVFGIEASRIKTQGRTKPAFPSQQPGSTHEFDLLHEGDRRVSIETSSPELLMEFQSGPNAPLKPLEIVTVQEAPIESYLTFNNEGSEEAFNYWQLEVKDSEGKIQYFGPYTQNKLSMPGKTILGDKPEGDYTVTMIGTTKKGKTIKKETNVHMVLWTPPKSEEVMRFSVIYEFNESKAISLYEKYLQEIVINKIPQGGSVLIHGHTDVIGDPKYNEKLSWARANDVKAIMEAGLIKKGRSDVVFQIYGFGEDEKSSPFNNKYPEERFYNRTVIIDILPN